MFDDLLEKRPFDIPLVVLDTETTGLDPAMGHRVVEIGAVRFENGQKVAEMDQLLQPERRMDPGASRVNGIDDEDLLGQPTFAQIAPDLTQLLDGALLLAHNAAFDAGFLGVEYAIYGTSRQPHTAVPANPWLCTLLLARQHFYFGRNNLSHIAQKLGVRLGRAHRALNDVYMTAEIFKRMSQQLAQQHRLITVADLLHAQGGVIQMPPLPQVETPPLIAEALENGRSLRIFYLGPSGETQRTITPKYLTQNKGHTYLVAYCHSRQDQRTFRLDRISSAVLLEPHNK